MLFYFKNGQAESIKILKIQAKFTLVLCGNPVLIVVYRNKNEIFTSSGPTES